MVMTTVTMDNRTLPRAELRAKIYVAAISTFREQGYRRATIEAITARAQVAKGTFFNFYKTKLDVLTEYYWQVDARIAPLRAALDPRKPLHSLARYARRVEREFAREGELLVDLLMETMSDEALRQVDHESGESDARQFAQFFDRARALGTARADLDPQKAADLLIDVWAGSIRRWLAAKRGPSLAAIFKSKVAEVFRGLGPQEGLQ
jgi:AcrR family transcriptional regulator